MVGDGENESDKHAENFWQLWVKRPEKKQIVYEQSNENELNSSGFPMQHGMTCFTKLYSEKQTLFKKKITVLRRSGGAPRKERACGAHDLQTCAKNYNMYLKTKQAHTLSFKKNVKDNNGHEVAMIMFFCHDHVVIILFATTFKYENTIVFIKEYFCYINNVHIMYYTIFYWIYLLFWT